MHMGELGQLVIARLCKTNCIAQSYTDPVVKAASGNSRTHIAATIVKLLQFEARFRGQSSNSRSMFTIHQLFVFVSKSGAC
ncbi:hypothetical protein DAEQUDRAFT_723929 [Daedalea quercina L-15889]|uniref:Uncharacterized protein n=1 Tax=Daedalea quercina L-15889 TaxID=1314783 RepID=A0A165SDJ9_9APHY|nr:hypothetical protein DAEQUDRAFT_723929 [Daedalea quercina L-15889]